MNGRWAHTCVPDTQNCPIHGRLECRGCGKPMPKTKDVCCERCGKKFIHVCECKHGEIRLLPGVGAVCVPCGARAEFAPRG